jgi:hypothetical protein
MRIEFDAHSGNVYLWIGVECLDCMTLLEYQELFGFKAASQLARS